MFEQRKDNMSLYEPTELCKIKYERIKGEG